MPHSPNGLEAADRAGVFVPHAFPETLADLGEPDPLEQRVGLRSSRGTVLLVRLSQLARSPWRHCQRTVQPAGRPRR